MSITVVYMSQGIIATHNNQMKASAFRGVVKWNAYFLSCDFAFGQKGESSSDVLQEIRFLNFHP